MMKRRLPFLLIAMLLFAVQFQSNAQTYVLQKAVSGAGGSVKLINPDDSTHLYGIVGQIAIFSFTGNDAGVLHQGFWVPDYTVSVEDNPISLSELLVNYPNPFSNTTVIKYQLPGNGFVTLRVFDNVGRLKKVLVNEIQPQGQQEIAWDGKDDNGTDCASGSYIYELSVRPSKNIGLGSFSEINLRNMMVIVR